jgi:hypothetical protein
MTKRNETETSLSYRVTPELSCETKKLRNTTKWLINHQIYNTDYILYTRIFSESRRRSVYKVLYRDVYPYPYCVVHSCIKTYRYDNYNVL